MQRALKIQAGHKRRLEKAAEETGKTPASVLNDAALDGRLCGIKASAESARTKEQQLHAFNQLSSIEQMRAKARMAVLEKWAWFASEVENKAQSDCVAAFIDAFKSRELSFDETLLPLVPRISRATLFRWRSAFKTGGMAALAMKNNPEAILQRCSLIDSQPELKEWIISALAEMPHQKATNLHMIASAHFSARSDIRVPGVRALGRWLARWKAGNMQLFTRLANPDEYKNKYLPAFGSRSERVTSLNQVWELDSTPADIMCTDGRFTLIGSIDIYSRRPMVRVHKTSNAYGIALNLRRAIIEYGVPRELVIDNGRDYKSRHIRIACDALDIALTPTNRYSGQEKPFIERFFRTLSHGLLETMPGFIGHNVAERKAIEAKYSFAERLNRKGETIPVELSSSDLQLWVDQWVEAVYMQRHHMGIKCSPAQRVQEWQGVVRRVEDERTLDLLLASAPGNSGRRVVQKKGIQIDTYFYICPELALHIGDEVQVRFDESDYGLIYVFSLDNQFICIAENPQMTGVSMKEIAHKAKQKKKALEAEARRIRRKSKRTVSRRDAAEKVMKDKEKELQMARKNVVDFPKPSEVHNSRALAGARDAIEAKEERESASYDAYTEEEKARFKKAAEERERKRKEKEAAEAKKPKVFLNDTDKAMTFAKESVWRELTEKEQLFLDNFRSSSGFRNYMIEGILKREKILHRKKNAASTENE